MVDIKSDANLLRALKEYETLVNYDYLLHLKDSHILPSNCCIDSITVLRVTQLPRSESAFFYIYTLNALGNLCSALGYILHCTNHCLTLYIVLKTYSPELQPHLLLENGLRSAFPKAIFTRLPKSSGFELLFSLFNPCTWNYLSNTIIIPSKSSSPSILNSLTELMAGEAYTALFLAAPIPSHEISHLISLLKKLYNELFPYSQYTHNWGCSKGKNNSHTHTDNDSSTNGENHSDTNTQSLTHSQNGHKTLTLSSPVSLSPSCQLNTSLLNHCAKAHSHCDNHSFSCSQNHASTHAHTFSHLSGHNLSKNEGQNISFQNKYVIDAISRLNTLITRLESSISTPCFQFTCYFLSLHPQTSIRAAYTYAGLAQDSNMPMAPYYINTWSYLEPDYSLMVNELSKLNMPSFISPINHTSFTPSEIILNQELVNALNFIYSQHSN